MKILYTANERNDAQLAATALRSIAQNVTVAWAGHLYDARRWVAENQDLSALVVEAQVQNQSCASFVGHVRSLGLTAPILVVAPEGEGLPLAALKAGADDYVVKNQSLLPNLTAIVRHTLRRAETRPRPLRVLYVGDAALARECLDTARCSIELTEAMRSANGRFQPIPAESGTAGRPLPFDVLLVEHDYPGVDTFAILKDVAARQLAVPVIVVVEWDEALAIPALKLGATDYVVKAKDSFRALLFQLDRRHREQARGGRPASHEDSKEAQESRRAAGADAAIREQLEQQVRDTQAALREAERRSSALNAANERLLESEARLQAAVEQERINREALDQKLAKSDVALQRAEQIRASAVASFDRATQALERAQQDRSTEAAAAAKRLARREAELAAARADGAARESLEARLAELEAALHEAEERESSERAAWQQISLRQAELEAQFDEDLEQRKALAEKLAAAEAALEQSTAANEALEKKLAEADAAGAFEREARALEASSHADQLTQQGDAFTLSLTQVIRSRDALEQQVSEAALALERAQREHAVEADAAAALLEQRETELADAATNHQLLERRLADLETTLEETERRAAAERQAADQQAAERHAEVVAQLDRESANREAIEQGLAAARKKIADTEEAIRDAERRHASDIETASAQFADKEAQYEIRLAQVEAERDVADRQLREAEARLERSQQERASETAAAAERLSLRDGELAESVASRQVLEGRLADADAALKAAEQRASDERIASAQQAAQRQAEFEAKIAWEVAGRRVVDQDLAASKEKLAESESALRDAERRHAADRAAAANDLAERQADFERRLAEAAAVNDAVDRRRRDAEETLERIRREREAEAAAAAERLARRESELAVARAALETAAQNAATERLASAREAAARQAEFDARLAQELETRRSVERDLAAIRQDLARAEASIRDARQLHASDMAAAAAELCEQQGQYENRLARSKAAQEALDRQLHEVDATLERVRRERDAEAVAAARQAAERQAEFDAQIAREIGARVDVEHDLAETRASAAQARQAFLDESAVLIERMHDREARLTKQLARERADHESTLADAEGTIRGLTVERDGLRQSVAASQEQLSDLSRAHEDAKESFERARQAKDAELLRLGRDYAALRHTLDQVRADASKTLDRVMSEHAAEVARAEAAVAERDERIKDQAARNAASQEAAQQTQAKLESELRAVAADRTRQVQQLRNELEALARELDATRSRRDALKIDADRVPQLTTELEGSRAEIRRQFEQSPVGILRCTRAGGFEDANRALINVLGYRTIDELRAIDFADAVLESADDLRWLVERCQRTPREAVDSIWKKKDGSRLVMRLRVVGVSTDAVDIMAQDLTSLRAVEERLRQAQRMEAVGRLASEVAVTCDNLLRNVGQDGQQWLATVGVNPAQRHHGELILGEVARAASFLRQLSVYGAQQTGALAPVDVNKVLRDMEPVLKRVAGDDIEVVLPKKAAALNVDVDAERVERVLVNVAAYGRSRMPSGGRLMVDLSRVTVDRNFVTKYPNVRQGAHALITVTETRARTDWPIGFRGPADASASKAAAEHPGVDLGALQALIRDCGGHLWMKAEPDGDMEVKIRLPLRPGDAAPSAGGHRSGRGRSVGRWFQS